jgi:hypothetical protein
VAIEEAVFLRSGEIGGGDITVSFCADVFRESHENGLVNFRDGGGAGAGRFDAAGTCGGGAHGTDGRTPESPCNDGLADFGGRAGFESSCVNLCWLCRDAIRNENLPVDVVGFTAAPSSSRLTLSRDVVESRCEVSRGDFGCVESYPF